MTAHQNRRRLTLAYADNPRAFDLHQQGLQPSQLGVLLEPIRPPKSGRRGIFSYQRGRGAGGFASMRAELIA